MKSIQIAKDQLKALQEDCPECGGSGRKWRDISGGMHCKPCPTCQGTGKIKDEECATTDYEE